MILSPAVFHFFSYRTVNTSSRSEKYLKRLLIEVWISVKSERVTMNHNFDFFWLHYHIRVELDLIDALAYEQIHSKPRHSLQP